MFKPNKAKMREIMKAAIYKDENRFSNGQVNWDFVDADVYVEVFDGVDTEDRNNDVYYRLFDELVFEHDQAEIALITKLNLMQATGMVH